MKKTSRTRHTCSCIAIGFRAICHSAIIAKSKDLYKFWLSELSGFKTQKPVGAGGKCAYDNTHIHTHTFKFLHIYSILNMYEIHSSLLKYYLNIK